MIESRPSFLWSFKTGPFPGLLQLPQAFLDRMVIQKGIKFVFKKKTEENIQETFL